MTAAAWATALEGFAVHLEASNRSAAAVETYLKHVGWLAESAPAGPWELTTSQLAEWLDGRAWSRHTRRKVLVAYRTFYAWAVGERLCEWAPTAGLPSAAPNKRGPKPRRHSPVWEAALEEFVAWGRAGGRSEGTLGVRRWWLSRLAEVSADPWGVSTQQLATWLGNPDWSAETKRAARASVRSFYRWAVLNGRVSVSPAETLDSVLVARALPKPAPTEALRAALAAADDRTRVAGAAGGSCGAQAGGDRDAAHLADRGHGPAGRREGRSPSAGAVAPGPGRGAAGRARPSAAWVARVGVVGAVGD